MVQVDKTHYFFHNVKAERFQLYYRIIKTVLELNVGSVLEIGIGQGVVSHVLKFNGLLVVKADFDLPLRPHVACDIRQLPFKRNKFDLVLASEVLEHIPFADVEMALMNIHRLTRKYTVISVPFNQHHFAVYLNVKILRYLYFRGIVNKLMDHVFPLYLYLGLSLRKRDFHYHGEHYWEVGYENYPIGKVRNLFRKYFSIEQELRVRLSPYHYIFVLKKQ